MIKQAVLPVAASLAIGLGWVAPIHAQRGALIVYGNDPCPANTICVRAKESERYRIPPSLRAGTLSPSQQPWGKRAADVASAGGDRGPGACTNVGGGGGNNCMANILRQAREEKAQANAEAAASPIPR